MQEIKKHMRLGIYNIPFNKINRSRMFDEQVKQIIEKESNKLFVIYCDSEQCNLAKGLANFIKDTNKNIRVVILLGGIKAWEKSFARFQ